MFLLVGFTAQWELAITLMSNSNVLLTGFQLIPVSLTIGHLVVEECATVGGIFFYNTTAGLLGLRLLADIFCCRLAEFVTSFLRLKLHSANNLVAIADRLRLHYLHHM